MLLPAPQKQKGRTDSKCAQTVGNTAHLAPAVLHVVTPLPSVIQHIYLTMFPPAASRAFPFSLWTRRLPVYYRELSTTSTKFSTPSIRWCARDSSYFPILHSSAKGSFLLHESERFPIPNPPHVPVPGLPAPARKRAGFLFPWVLAKKDWPPPREASLKMCYVRPSPP